MASYYSTQLAGGRLSRVYEIAPPRVQQYLEAEIQHLLSRIGPADDVLELGCGYGRVLSRLVRTDITAMNQAGLVVGIDTSFESLAFGAKTQGLLSNCHLACMDAAALGFAAESFDRVVCVQNGLSAFKIEPLVVVREVLRVTKWGGAVLLSSYSEKFWDERLRWFERQAESGLVGPIDHDKTGNGVIVCTDGFAARTISANEFRGLANELGVNAQVAEVDDSSLFCEIHK